jgi:hypothetical protein
MNRRNICRRGPWEPDSCEIIKVHLRISLKPKGRRVFRLFWLLVLSLAVIGGCTLPQAPGRLEWDVNLAVPLGVRTYGIWDMVDPDSVLRANGSGIGMEADSSVYFSAWTDLSVSVEDCLYVEPGQFSILKELDAIPIAMTTFTTRSAR